MSVTLALDVGLVESCTTTGSVVVEAGDHIVGFELIGVGADTTGAAGSLNVVWASHDGTGEAP